MLRRRFDMSDLAGRMLLQVGASMAATLVASTLLALVPHGSLASLWSSQPPAVELTSGGKFAARVPGLEDVLAPVESADFAASEPVAPDMLAPPEPATPVPVDVPAAMTTAPADRIAHPAKPHNLRVGATRRPDGATRHMPPAITAALPVPRPSVLAVNEASMPEGDETMMSRMVSSARSLWSVTASTSGALLSRLTP